MSSWVVEGEGDEGAGGLGRVAAAAGVGVEDVADLGLAMLDGAEPDGHRAEEQVVLAADHGQGHRVVIGREAGLGDVAGQGRGGLVAGARLPVEELRHLGKGLDGREAVKVIGAKAAQDQSLGLQLQLAHGSGRASSKRSRRQIRSTRSLKSWGSRPLRSAMRRRR